MKKLLSVLLSLIMVLTLLAACSKPAEEGGEQPAEGGEAEGGVQVGIVLPTKDEPRWTQDEASFNAALGEAGFTSQVLFSQGSSATELTNVETLIENGAKVIVLCPHDAAGAVAAVQKAKEAGVTVISYDRFVPGTDDLDYHVEFNSFVVGQTQGQYLIDKYAGKTGVPLYLYSGGTFDNNAFIFFAGAWSVLNKAVESGQFVVANCPEIAEYVGKELDPDADHETLYKIMATVDTQWDPKAAKPLAEGNLVANDASAKGDVAILAPNDGTARAIADAFAADADVKSWVITGQDAEMASLKYVQEGKQSMTIFKNTGTLANETCAMVSTILGGGAPTTNAATKGASKDIPTLQIPVTLVDQETLPGLISDGIFDQAKIDSAQ
jgi:putative multiple sugar transport system substrate-binding protein